MPTESTETSPKRPVALVMAASRRGAEDPVARMQNKSHKCLVEIDGTVMLEIVVGTLIESDCFERIYISVESPDILRATPALAQWFDDGTIAHTPSSGNLADSVWQAAQDIPDPFPLVITTGDNALHTPELVRDFVAHVMKGTRDVAVAFTRADLVRRDYPAATLSFHELKDGGFSSCNLYALRGERALRAANIFKSGGQFGKRHMRILKSLGVLPFFLYKTKLATLDGLMTRIGRNIGVSVDSVLLPYGFGPIDVDNATFFAVTEDTLKQRRAAG